MSETIQSPPNPSQGTSLSERLVKVRSIILMMGVALAIFVPVWFMVAALGTRFDLWSWQVGLVKMIRGIGMPLLLLLIVETIGASVIVMLAKPRGGFAALSFMWAVSLVAVGMTANAMKTAQTVPPIHDISTNPAAPLAFSPAVMTARGAASNPVKPPAETTVPFNPTRPGPWSGRTLVEIQADAYPAIQPKIIEGKTPADVYQAAEAAIKARKWTLVTQDPAGLRLEATAQSFWFGFKDDVVVQITPVANGAQVDARSVSRVGISDLGANAKRLDGLLKAIGG